MNRIRPDVDIVNDILVAVIDAQPLSAFAKSLHQQYQERGSLSKKQLQGLYGKASKVASVAPAKLATLEAMILKKPNRYKSGLPEAAPLYQRNEEHAALIKNILSKYPEHKRVLFIQSRFENNEPLTATEVGELNKFSKMIK